MMKRGFLNSAAATETRPLLGRLPPLPRAPASQLSINQFSLERFVGRGNFCEVFEAVAFDKSLFNNKPVALKIYDRHRVTKLQKSRDVVMERHCLLRLNDPGHPNIIRMLGTFKDEERVCIIYELADNGELWDNIRYAGIIFDEELITRYIFSLVSAVAYIHSKGIIHRDIKAENLVVMYDGNIKLIDFGTAVDVQNPAVQPAVLGAIPPIHLSNQSNISRRRASRPSFAHHVGTPQFMSPESIQNQDSGYMRDLWSVGCTIYQMLAGYPPFDASTNYFVFLRVQSGDLDFPPSFPQDAKHLVQQLLAANIKERLGSTKGIEEVWQHPFFTSRLQRVATQQLFKLRLLQNSCDPQHTQKQQQHLKHQQQHLSFKQQQEQQQQQQQQHQQQQQQQHFQQQEQHNVEDEIEEVVGNEEVIGGSGEDAEGAQQQEEQQRKREVLMLQEHEEEENGKKREMKLQDIEEYMARTAAPVASLQELCMRSILQRLGELLNEEETKQLDSETEAFHTSSASNSTEIHVEKEAKDETGKDKEEGREKKEDKREREERERRRERVQRDKEGDEHDDEEEEEREEKRLSEQQLSPIAARRNQEEADDEKRRRRVDHLKEEEEDSEACCIKERIDKEAGITRFSDDRATAERYRYTTDNSNDASHISPVNTIRRERLQEQQQEQQQRAAVRACAAGIFISSEDTDPTDRCADDSKKMSNNMRCDRGSFINVRGVSQQQQQTEIRKVLPPAVAAAVGVSSQVEQNEREKEKKEEEEGLAEVEEERMLQQRRQKREEVDQHQTLTTKEKDQQQEKRERQRQKQQSWASCEESERHSKEECNIITEEGEEKQQEEEEGIEKISSSSSEMNFSMKKNGQEDRNNKKKKKEEWDKLLEKAMLNTDLHEKYIHSASKRNILMQLLQERVQYAIRSRKKRLLWQQKIADQWLAESRQRHHSEEEIEEEVEEEKEEEEIHDAKNEEKQKEVKRIL